MNKKYTITDGELKELGINRCDYEIARMQYIINELNDHKIDTKSHWDLSVANCTIFFNALLKQSKCLPEPNDRLEIDCH